MTGLLTAPLAVVGRSVLGLLGGYAAASRSTSLTLISHILRPPWYPRELAHQLLHIGWLSLPVVGLTALFTGGALALQIYAGGSRFNAEAVVPQIVAIGITRELGPVLGGLMVAGRVAAAIAAEIGTMKVTEQIDALVTLSTNPMKYLAVPRVLAATLSLPILVAVGDSIGIFGGYLVGTTRLGFDQAAYISNTVDFLETWDIVSGLIKGAVFGCIVATMGCYHGMASERGARGVGRATTKAVVSASILILASNYILTEVFFSA
jgi:phospholipid/cholesterol/gamma-HCH transport system permease protein